MNEAKDQPMKKRPTSQFGSFHGQGTYTYHDGRKRVGEWNHGKPWNPTIYDKNGNIISKRVNVLTEMP